MKNLRKGNAEGPKEKLKHFVLLSISQDFAGVQFGLPWGNLRPPLARLPACPMLWQAKHVTNRMVSHKSD